MEIQGRLACADILKQEDLTVLIFEMPHDTAGPDLVVIGCDSPHPLNQMKVGDFVNAAFDARSVVSFDEDIQARKKGKARLRIGKFSGHGILEDSAKCNFQFRSDMLPGKWGIAYSREKRDGFLSRLMTKEELILRRIE
jgi:hypothetical protein